MKTPRIDKAQVGRGTALFTAVLIAATVAPQILGVKTVAADDGGYPWVGATQLFTTPVTYDWGYGTCPYNDTGCMGVPKVYNGVTYGEEDPYTMDVRNCTSYAAWKINQYISQSFANWGNASNWHNMAPSGTVKSPSTYTPVFGDLALWDSAASGLGHVAFVTNVSGSTVNLAEYNSGYPLDVNGRAQWGLFYAGETVASRGTPSEYIHLSPNGNPISSMLDSNGYQHAFVGDSNGNIHDTYWQGTGTPQSWQPNTSQLGAAIVSINSQEVSGVIHVYAATSAGSLDDVYWGNGVPQGQPQLWVNGVVGNVISSIVDASGYQNVHTSTAIGNIWDTYWLGVQSANTQKIQ